MIYIAGKISGLNYDEVLNKFQKAENELHRLGVKVINPLKLGIPESWAWDQQLEKCLKIIRDRATGIFLLNDWNQSKGARIEFQEVATLNSPNRPMSIYFEDMNGYLDVRRDVEDKVLTCLIPD